LRHHGTGIIARPRRAAEAGPAGGTGRPLARSVDAEDLARDADFERRRVLRHHAATILIMERGQRCRCAGGAVARILGSMNETEISPAVRPARVVVGVTGSASSCAALRRAVFEARRSGSVLIPVLAWEPPGGELAYRTAPEPGLAGLWARRAQERLEAAITAAGGIPLDVMTERVVVRAPAAYALNALADQAGDLLVLGAGPRDRLARLLRGRVRRGTTARAQAPVLLVSPPSTPRKVRRDLRKVTPEDFLQPGRGDW
jgi:nucleotide-binding universal stress UspA family protein